MTTPNEKAPITREQLIKEIQKKKSFLIIGLDSDITKIPKHLLGEEYPQLAFNKAIIDTTHDLVVGYKPNLAFYEARGSKGFKELEMTVAYINDMYPKLLIIADAKRGDIGNTSQQYAKAFFETMSCDAMTVAPYMGSDSVKPFLQYPGKFVIVLALTSNEGSKDFQMFEDGQGIKLFQEVLDKTANWGTKENIMFVVGATKAEWLAEIRKIVPNHFLLIPAVGAQGGSLEEVVKYGITPECGLLVNNSRQIIFAGNGTDFAEKARTVALGYQKQMHELLIAGGVI